MAAIPLVDIAPFRQGGGRDAVVAQFGAALENIGFVAITGHGIDPDLIDGTYAAARAFFSRDLQDKLRFNPPEQTKGRGYLPLGIESVAATLDAPTPPDLCEALVFPNVTRAVPGYPGFPLIWPDQPAELRPRVQAYYAALEALALVLLRIGALALDLPEDFFQPYFAPGSNVLRLVNYPDQPTPPLPGQLRYGAHHDYGSFTIVRQDAAPGGLEVFSRDGDWVPMPPYGDAFVVNVGELLSNWTNGRWRATLHRVVNPPRDLTGSTQRLSMVLFTGPNEEKMISCLPTCCSAANPPRFPPVRAGEFIMRKLARSHDLPAHA